MDSQKFEMYALVELFGHQKIAGLVSEQVVAGQGMLRVDVPETKANPAFTKLYNPSAVYGINPVDKETCMAYAENLEVKPIAVWDVRDFLQKTRLALAGASTGDADFSDDDLLIAPRWN